jgi:spore cortex biosynthesis protein YabQ
MTDVFSNGSYVAWMLIAGWCMGTAFDFYSTVTGSTKYLRWMRPGLDLGFWLSAGVVVYYLTYITIWGEFRVYTFLLLGVGYLVYRAVFRKVVIGSAFVVVRIVKALLLFVGRLLYRLIGVPIFTCWRALAKIILLLYKLGCRIEDVVSAVLGTCFKIIFFPVRKYLDPERPWRKKLHTWEQGFWDRLSNVLEKKPPSVS